MSYLKFDKSLMVNLEKSLTKEMLRTNKMGAYSVTTIADCNTRKYDGLLVVPIPELSDSNFVLLSSLDETVIQHGAAFNMGIHKFQGDYYSPKGHKYIREFTMETVACTTYRVGGVVFSKERVFISDENRILIKYTMLDAQSIVTMRFKPFLVFRSVNELSHVNDSVIRDYSVIDNGISTKMYPNFPMLSMQFSKKNQFIFEPNWYQGIEYIEEQERGYDFKEDLYAPGYFELEMKKGESIIFSAGIGESKSAQFKKMYDGEISKRTSRVDFFNCLKNAGQQFYNRIAGGNYIMAGYPWFNCRARDEFVSLPGIALATDRVGMFEKVMETALAAISDFIDGKPNVSKIHELDAPDVLFWAIWSIQQYAKKTSVKQAADKYGNMVLQIITFIRNQKHPKIELHENGLLFVNGTNEPASWMNGTVWGRPVTPRTGYLVELNALWYNALEFAIELIKLQGNSYEEDLLTYQAENAKQSFVKTFWSGKYLYDYVINNDRNPEVRPNMLFAVSLPYSPLEKAQQKSVLDIVTRELSTPRGVRSLSPKSGLYQSEYSGNEVERNNNYHNGTVWPWLFGAYAEAYLKLHKVSGLAFLERNLIGFESEMGENCIGTLNELFDGNPPFKARGAMSFAMSVGEILRTMTMLREYAKHIDESKE